MKKLVLVPLFLLTQFLLLAMTPAEFALTCSAKEMQEAIAEGLDPNINLDYSSINTGLNGRAFSINGIPISVYASGNPDTGVLETLIANGADVSEKSEVLKKALMLDYATLDSVKILLPYCNPTQVLPDAASYSTNTAVVEYIASQVGSLNYRRGGGSYYLAKAVQNGSVDNAKLLIRMGADIHETTLSDGSDPTRNLLMLAAESGSVEMCEYILSLGYDVNEVMERRTALFHASNDGTAQFLIDAGATELSTSSQWVITEALQKSRLELAAFYVNTIAEDDEIPSYVYNYIDRYYLNRSQAYHNYVLRFASGLEESKQETFKKHIAYRLVDSETDLGRYDAVKEYITLLIALDYDFGTELDEEGNTLLHFAAIADDELFDYIPYLLEAGADPDTPDNKGITPFIWLLKRVGENEDSDDDEISILLEMIEHGCDLDAAVTYLVEEELGMVSLDVEAFTQNIAKLRSQL